MVGVAPVSCTMRTWTWLVSSGISGISGVSGSSPSDDAELCENRVLFVVDVDVELDDCEDWMESRCRCRAETETGVWEEEEKSPRPADMNLPTPWTPSLMPSNIAPCPMLLLLLLFDAASWALSNFRETIRSHLRFTTKNKSEGM
jgi:hypothetical protein